MNSIFNTLTPNTLTMNPNTNTRTLLRDAVSRRKKRRDETPREYASAIASIIHRGWSFLGKDAKWFNERVDEVENLLAHEP